MASVWVARHRTQPDRLVAIKAILPALARDLEFRGMFLDEGRIAGSINHENVVSIYDVAEDRGVLYMAMEWVEGDALRAVIKEARARRPIPFDLSARVVADAAAGLHAAHELRALDGELRHLVHCDVSPHNILIGLDGSVKLVDFGVASAVGHVNELGDGRVRGKFGYMSPEQARGDNLDRRSDVFSLAIVLYELTTGKRLFQGGGPKETLELVQRGEIPPPCEISPGYPGQLQAIILKGLERDVRRRFQTAAELQRSLEQFLTDSGTVVPRAGVAGLLRRVLRERLVHRRAMIRQTVAALDGARSIEESSCTAPAVSLEVGERTSTDTHGPPSQAPWTPPTSHGAAFLPGGPLPAPTLPPRGTSPAAAKPRQKRALAVTVVGGLVAGIGGISVLIAALGSGASDSSPTTDAKALPAQRVASPALPAAPSAPAETTDGHDELAGAVSLDSLSPVERKQRRRTAPAQPAIAREELALSAPAPNAEREAEGMRTVQASSKTNTQPPPDAPDRSHLDNAIAQLVGADEEKIVLEEEVETERPTAKRDGARLNRGAALAVLGKAALQAGRCRFDGDPTGTGRVRVTFDTDGRVSSVRVPAPFRGTRAGDCVENAFSGARIPEFRGTPVTLKRRFRIRKGD